MSTKGGVNILNVILEMSHYLPNAFTSEYQSPNI